MLQARFTLQYTKLKGQDWVMEMLKHSTLQCSTVPHFHDLAVTFHSLWLVQHLILVNTMWQRF